MVNVLPAIVLALLGALVATLSRTAVHRLPIHLRMRGLEAHCGNCGVATQPTQRWFALARGQNRFCNTCDIALWPKTPGLEIFTAVVLAVVGAKVGWSWNLLPLFVFFVTLCLITAIDLKHYVIPTKLIWPALFLTIALLLVASLIVGNVDHFYIGLAGMAAAWFFFFVVWFIYPAGMGFGDVRLSALVGLMSGYVSFGNVFISVILALFIGAFVGVVLILLRLRNRKQAIPFGPFLAAGSAISVLFGNYL